jgi:hypothetical protein
VPQSPKRSEARPPEYRARLLRAYTATVEAGAPEHGKRRTYDDGRARQYEFLILPLAANGSIKIDKLLVAVVHLDRVAGEASDIYRPAELEAAAVCAKTGRSVI